MSPDTRRRTLLKSLIWRIIGITWTWIGAYIILILVPKEMKTAIVVASLITIYHHSTRAFMYYGYERLWSYIKWGQIPDEELKIPEPLTTTDKIKWTILTSALVMVVVLLLVLLRK